MYIDCLSYAFFVAPFSLETNILFKLELSVIIGLIFAIRSLVLNLQTCGLSPGKSLDLRSLPGSKLNFREFCCKQDCFLGTVSRLSETDVASIFSYIEFTETIKSNWVVRASCQLALKRIFPTAYSIADRASSGIKSWHKP